MANQQLEVGVALTTSVTPVFAAGEQRDYVERLAVAADNLGFSSVWLSDRTVYPVDLARRYPAQFGGDGLDPRGQNVLEALTTLGYVAGITKRVRLGLSVLVFPFRNPILNAKMLTTLDVLSGGRLLIGAGTGWMPEEFSAMGATFSDRGPVTDDHLLAFKALCAGEPSYAGRHVAFENVAFHPPPHQKPHPPVWIGGNSDAALKRAARLGDGWHGIRLTPDETAYKSKVLAGLLARAGRAPGSVAVTLRHTLRPGAPEVDMDGLRTVLTGGYEQIASDLVRYRSSGVSTIVLSISAASTDATVEIMEKFSVEVLPRLRDG
ncbi:MAG: TIGR03619 family F420-dependent LLM class oxidoreductase [SAR202 cluster bacterium]|nr:TIGR03619 family F420-dependent LLM class oxidoreductase [SAR202 cluster bacterium]